MKQRLLSLMAVAVLSATAMAQTWTAPIEPENPAKVFLETAAAPQADVNYYIMNVGEAQFLTGANVWATQISLSADGKPYMQITLDATDFENTYVLRRTNDSQDLFYGDHGRDAGYNPPAGRNHLFRSGDDGYVDMNNQGGDYFLITPAESGFYYIQSSPDQGAFANAYDEYAGSTGAGKYVSFTKTIEDANIEWAFIPVDYIALAGYDEKVQAYVTALEIYKARQALYELLNEASQYNVDYAAASATYNNADATAEELTAATTALRPAVTRAIVLAKIPEASEENPLDITQYTIVNPDFENGMAPWTITEGMGANLQVQSKGYPEGAEQFLLQNFIEAWFPTSTGPLKDGVICQTVSGLPEGRYRIEANVMAVWQGGDIDIYDQTGIYLFYNNGSYTVHSDALSTGNGFPEHFTFDFDFAGADEMTIGLMAESTNCNWMGMDNFRLYAIGECQDSPAWTALATEYNVASEFLSDIKAEESAISGLSNALADAEALVNAPSDKAKDAEYTAALNAIIEARKTLAASADAYKNLDAFISQLLADDDKYGNMPGYEAFAKDIVEPLLDRCEDAYNDGSWSPEQIQAEIEAYKPLIKEYTQKAFDEAVASGASLEQPIDITMLFDHMSFEYGTSQTAFADGYPAANEETGVTPVWMNETHEGNFKTNYSTAEVWNNRPFNIYREFQNLPKGRYTIQTHAFFRVEDNDNNYPNWQSNEEYGKGYAYIYAGENQAPIINLAALACPEFVNLNSPYDCGDGNYLPNNQQSAYRIFTEEQFAAQAEKTLVSVSGNVLNDGDVLRVGVAGTDQLQGNHWTIWYSFSLLYSGAVSANDLNGDLQALIDQVSELNTVGVKEGIKKQEQALANAEAALGSSAIEDKVAAMNLLKEVIDYAKASDELTQKIITATQEYADKLGLLPGTPTDQSYAALLQTVDEAVINEDYDSNAQIENWLEQLATGWTAYVLSMDILDGATIDNPVDLSLLIANATFDNSNKDGWSLEEVEKSGTDADQCVEYWNTTSFDMYQVLPTLRDGYYRLSVNAFYRYGNSGDEVALITSGEELPNNAFFYVNDKAVNLMQWSDTEGGALAENDGTEGLVPYPTEDAPTFWAANSKAVFQGMIEAGRYVNSIEFGYGVEGGFTGEVRFGVRKAEKLVDYDWVPMDNFRLEYLGTNAPDAISTLAAEGNAAAATAIFTVDGRQQSTLRRGINIVRRADGSVSKVLQK